MAHYRCYFFKDERIEAPADVVASSDAEALLQASELLSTSRFLRIEVWQETRIVGSLSAPSPSP